MLRTDGSWGRLRVKGGTGSHAPSDRDSIKIKKNGHYDQDFRNAVSD